VLLPELRSRSRSRRFLGGVGFLTALGVGVGFFVRLRLRMSSWIIFTSHSKIGIVENLEPPRLFEFLLPDCKPIAAPSRRYSSEDMTFIRSEVQRLLDVDIIEPARSTWRTQVLLAKQGEKKMLVIDYSVIINRFTLLDAYPLPNIEDLVNRIARDKYFSSIDLRLAYHQVSL